MPQTKTAIAFISHTFTEPVLGAFEKLSREAQGYGDLYLISDGKHAPPFHLKPQTHVFDFQKAKGPWPQITGHDVVPGNCHLLYCDFFSNFETYDFVWFIEYDVRFSGPWSDFFALYETNPSDLLGCHIRRWDQEPDWCWWEGLSTGKAPLPPEDRLRAFLPIQRLSAKAFRTILEKLAEGWAGHAEAIIPSALQRDGLRIQDLGGDGPFTEAANQNRTYTSPTSPDGGLREVGTMRYRPAHAAWGEQAHMLYHPVKHEPLTLGCLWGNLRARAAFASRALGLTR